MSWAATVITVAAGVYSSVEGANAAKRMSSKQAALARAQADKLRARAAEEGRASKREIDSLRTLRSLDLPAFRQASEQALLQAQKGAERMQRQRAMGRLAPDVRSAIFGGQFQQYVGREVQRLGQYAGLTQQILQATERQQQIAMQTEQQATNIEYGGQAQAIETGAPAEMLEANMLGAVGQAAAQYASASQASKTAAEKSQAGLKKQILATSTADGKLPIYGADGAVDMEKLDIWLSQ